jgi:Uncharacterised nucleotidyltransferase
MNLYNFNLKFVCRCLALHYDEHDIDKIRNQLSGDDLSWQSVIYIANNYLVSPGLWSGLKSKGLVAILDDEISSYLSELHAMNMNRNSHLRYQLLEAIGTLNAAGITPLLLKGSGQLVQLIHNDLGSRIMSDLDILVPPEQLHNALNALASKGYRETEVSYDPETLHHWAPLMRPGEYGTIELHRQALNRFVAQVIPTEKIWQAAESKTIDGVQFYLPSATHSILICMLHSREFNHADDPRQFNLRSLHDLVAITKHHSAEIDWQRILRQMKDHGLGFEAEAQLLAAQRMFGMPLPSTNMPGPSARLHHVVSLAAMNWPIIEFLSRRAYDFSVFQIRQRYGCARHSVCLAAYRMRYLFSFLRYHFSNL